VTIAEWIEHRAANVPQQLKSDIVAALQADAQADVSQLPRACIAAATRLLSEIIRNQDFNRDGAAPLLAADALTTYAFEYVAETGMKPDAIQALAQDAATQLGGARERK
jgi:hypothetical protein